MSQVAVVQMNSQADVLYNMGEARLMVREAAECGAQLVLLPEMFLTLDGSQFQALADDDGWVKQLSQWAREFGIWLVAGAVPQNSPDGDPRVRSACLVFDHRGHQVARYDKIHLFDVDVGDTQGSYKESRRFAPGNELVVIDSPVGKLGLSICFDVRFPEQYQALTAAGAEVLLVPAAFTHKTGQVHWQTLLTARAVENQCYIVAADQCGWHDDKRQTWGHSCVIDPWGKVLTMAGEEPGVSLADIDLQRLQEIRRAMPLNHVALNTAE
ncbi:MAG: amidohydrolase [Oceanospirillaceae bacterium]|uniref:carbon-nitrogen hydrolase family protein n=2 Tax=unclassified Thalassolituus TaxID=2624967 RepID=UPI000C09B51B|nr:carbon-nitrogen hydrolase family protein [Thalassolituus sp. UBA6592]MAK91635.1 amidohydrolase [Thalassolituus sp.]MAS24720.1 amidohydrolase [Oceanospirillaceae bacterium]MAX99884.1 amidohydrolase [Oceanospirillaceae bacterium]MBL36496.1 amidohydrolase [Oceanospirillaceae bacterium]MBS54537.1 amidohydrolase [Oceanospirillaceae bacterium]